LLPLLFRAVRTHSIEVSNAFLTILKTASLREELRTKTYRVIARRVLSVLANREYPAIPIRGVVLGETVYPDPALRHSHDIEILVGDGDPDEVGRSLIAAEFSPSRTLSRSGPNEFVHPSGLPLVLHRGLFEIPFYNEGLQVMKARARTELILDTRVPILSPADTLLHICGHAACSVRRDSHRWVGDAWFTIDRYRDLDWELLLAAARQAHLALPLLVMLPYLREQLDSPVPVAFLDRLAQAASRTPPIGRELALHGARLSPRGGFRHLIREAGHWHGRLQVVRWMLSPSRAYVSWVSGRRRSWLVSAEYVARPVRYGSRRTRSVLMRVVRSIDRALRARASRLAPHQPLW
jgi:hypothetical protein